ncbi:FHA domain-containing protein [Myxococcaceae bacterium GXIMD 01537]
MSVRLTVTQRGEAGGASASDVVLKDPVITLGRDKTCQVVLAQQAVSRNHARISQEGNLYFLEDLGSSYGTQVNGKALPKGEKRLLRNGDLIAIAQFDVRFDRVADVATDDGQSQKTSFLARNMVKDAMRGGEERFLRFMNGEREGERIEVSDAQELFIGREEGVEILIKADLVSRKHAKVRRDWSGTHVEDLGSRNGIRVNKKKVTRKQLKDGDEVEVGGIRLLYVDPSEPPEAPAEPVVRPSNSGVSSKPARERSSPAARKPAVVEEPKEEEKAEEPPPPEPEPAPPEPEPEPEPEPAYEPPPPEPEPDPEPPEDGLSRLGDKQKLVPLVVMGLFGLVALGLIIALLAGA